MEPVSPMTTRSEIRHKLPEASAGTETTIYLTTTDAGDGSDHDIAVWEQPRLVAPGRPDLLLRDVRGYIHQLQQRREQTFSSVVACLNAATEASIAQTPSDPAALATRYKVDPEVLTAWLDYLGISATGVAKIENHFTTKMSKVGGYDFVNGWGSDATPLLVANSSDQHVRIPGNMKPHSVAVHPAPTLQTVVGWRSPVKSTVRIEVKVQHAHPECGNGVTWSLDLRRGANRQRLATGIAHGPKEVVVEPIEKLNVQAGDVVSLLIGPRDGDHSCDLTAVDLTITTVGADVKSWDLGRDVSPNIQSANPHPDAFGNEAVWHFFTEPVTGATLGPVIPANSALAQWQSAANSQDRQQLAAAVQQLLSGEQPADQASPNSQLYRQLTSLSGPLFRALRPDPKSSTITPASSWGVDPALFGRHPDGGLVDPANLCVKAPSAIEVKLPADLVGGWELVTSGTLHRETGAEGTVQLQVLTMKPDLSAGLVAATVKEINANAQWTDNNRRLSYTTPILVSEGSAASRRVESAFATYRNLFPAALCYSRIVPVDEVVTLTLYYREDHHLSRLMLDEEQSAKLDRSWNELHFVSRDALTLVDGFQQLMEFATQDADPKVFEPLRKPIHDRAAAFKKELVAAEPRQLHQLIEFAGRAYRRPLTDEEKRDLGDLYRKLREQELPHDEAIRFTLARVLVAPAFLYRVEPLASGPVAGSQSSPSKDEIPTTPVSNWALASRLSYFLWSSMPDEKLRSLAEANKLQSPDLLVAQSKRMLKDSRARALATEFACQWLGVRL